jgi:DNA-binding MurR/RpiR family transcriptional regulator|tara:strand:- start:6198 stop:7094 length:897 start_codon:yes stop_codon:yes gene_type:complete
MLTRAELLTSLEADYCALPRQLQLAARYVVDQPDRVAFESLRGLAGLAKVSPATMLRLARHVGFADFDSFRQPFRDSLTAPTVENFTGRARDLQARRKVDGAANLLAEMATAEEQNLVRAFAPENVASLTRLAKILLTVDRVYLTGGRSCFAVAHLLHYSLALLREGVRLLQGDGSALFDGLRPLSQKDLLLVIGYDPYARESVATAQFARDSGAQVWAFTDSALSPLARLAQESVVLDKSHPSFFHSLLGAFAAAQVLVGLVAAEGGEEMLEILTTREDHLARFQAYWQAPLNNVRE